MREVEYQESLESLLALRRAIFPSCVEGAVSRASPSELSGLCESLAAWEFDVLTGAFPLQLRETHNTALARAASLCHHRSLDATAHQLIQSIEQTEELWVEVREQRRAWSVPLSAVRALSEERRPVEAANALRDAMRALDPNLVQGCVTARFHVQLTT